MNAIGRILAILVAMVLLTIFPIQYIAHLHMQNLDDLIEARLHELNEDIKREGKLKKESYDEFVRFLDETNQIYQIEIEDIEPVTFKRYSNPLQCTCGNTSTANAVMMDGSIKQVNCVASLIDNAKTTGSKSCITKVTVKKSDILTAIEVTPIGLEVEKYAEIRDYVQVIAVYQNGKRKAVSDFEVIGYNPAIPGKQNITIKYTEDEISITKQVTVDVKAMSVRCPLCNETYYCDNFDVDHGCPYCSSEVVALRVMPEYSEVEMESDLEIMVHAIMKNGAVKVVSDYTSDFDQYQLGPQEVTISYQGIGQTIHVMVQDKEIVCPSCGGTYQQEDEECPSCANQIIELMVTPKVIHVKQFEDFAIHVTARMKDGSYKIIHDWSISHTSSKQGNFQAKVSYQDMEAFIELNVYALSSIECEICGTIYEKSEYIHGCPNCFQELIGINAYMLNETNLVQKGTEPAIGVTAIFRDTHNEAVTDQNEIIITNYDKRCLGKQIITVSYQGFVDTIEIEVVEMSASVVCMNGHVYMMNEDGSDSSCPYCSIVNKNNSICYVEVHFMNEIIEQLDTKGEYLFQKGNYITIKVIKKKADMLFKMQGLLTGTAQIGYKRMFICGGKIRG